MEPVWVREMPCEASVQALGKQFASILDPPAVFYLRGDLGAGKTTFARALIHALGFKGRVKSPSYGLLETYATARMKILHLDLYRIEDPEELDYLAIRDLFDSGTALLVEWPERGEGNLPSPDLVLFFGERDGAREISCFAKSPAGISLAAKIMERV